MTSIQWTTLGLALIVIVLAVMRATRRKDKVWLRIPVILLMIHNVVYFTGKITGWNNQFAPLTRNYWVSIMLLQAVATFALLEIYGCWREKLWIPE
jgi:hypothetical protein